MAQIGRSSVDGAKPTRGGFLDGCRFVAHLSLGIRPRSVRERPIELAGMPAKVFEPTHRAARGTILTVHGVAPSGFDDPRMIDLARAFAACGFRALVPRIAPFTECTLSEDALAHVRDGIVEAASREELTPTGEVSIFAACVSASLALVAAAERPAAGLVRSVLALGPYAHVNRLLDHLLAGEDDLADAYGRTVVLYNWAHCAAGPLDEEVRNALWLEICDGHYGIAPGTPGVARPYIDARPAVARELERLTSRAFRAELVAVLKRERAALLDRMSPVVHLGGLEARDVVLVHGAGDDIVPSDESRTLHAALARRPAPATRLCVTPLIDHGDKQPLRASHAIDAVRLIRAFARFFDAARPDAPPPLPSWSPALARARGADV